MIWNFRLGHLLLVLLLQVIFNCHAHCKPSECTMNDGIIIKSKSNTIINAGEIRLIKKNNENKVLINSIKQWL